MNRVLWYVGRRHPLLFFGLPGMLLLAAGLVVGVSGGERRPATARDADWHRPDQRVL